ncbi:uncharacterized protein LOC110440741 [Mizuhopecten yessoensis]|nr:uncharacterized protein LOC110440741 [Mizuhopecten yessoensis]
MGYKSYDLSKNKAIRWGLDNEDKARTQYTSANKTVHNDFKCETTGLLIDHRSPFIGASADGLRCCTCCGKGTVEIKCPYKHRQRNLSEVASEDSSFYLTPDLKLKESHKYYTQVQMQMHVHHVQFCDFVVCTDCDMVIVVIPYNAMYCQEVVKKCQTFFQTSVLPEILTGKLETDICVQPSKITSKTYCLCGEPAYGLMVQCSNDSDCPMEWFHYKCVNIKRKPRGKWLCPECKA